MSKENAKAFVQAILEDEELREKTANMKPEDALPLGKEMGFDFTLEEFTDVMNVMNEDKELSPDELEAVTGGDKKAQNDMAKHDYYEKGNQSRQKNVAIGMYNKAHYCNGNPSTPHNFIVTYEDRGFFGAWTRTYQVSKCTLCGFTQEIHIKFGDDGTITYCT